MLLSYIELRRDIQNVAIFPVPDEHVNAASIDVTLGDRVFRESAIWLHTRTRSLGLREPLSFEEQWLRDGPLVLRPGDFVLACTQEIFNLPDTISAEFKLKSSVARMGINHALAGWCDAGWHGSALTLELHNVTRHHSIELNLGDRIGQMVFFRHAPVPDHASYAARGAYNNDLTTQAARAPKDALTKASDWVAHQMQTGAKT